jgi:hypothetical protein
MGVGRAKLVAVIVWLVLALNAAANLFFVSHYEMAAVPWVLLVTYLLLAVGFFAKARGALTFETNNQA